MADLEVTSLLSIGGAPGPPAGLTHCWSFVTGDRRHVTLTDAGGVPATAPHPRIDELAPLVARWAADHGLLLATAASSTGRALACEPDGGAQHG